LNISSNIAKLNTGVITSYALYILIGLILYLLFNSYINSTIIIVILLISLSLVLFRSSAYSNTAYGSAFSFSMFSFLSLFDSHYCIKPHSFQTTSLKSELVISDILAELNSLLPQLNGFINNFNTTVNQTGISVVTDSIGNLSIDVPKDMADDVANKVSTRIGIIDRLITTKGQEINELLQKGITIENKLKMENSHYQSQLTDKILEFKRLNSLYKH